MPSEIYKELEKTCPKNEEGNLILPSTSYLIETAKKIGYRHLTSITLDNESQKMHLNKETVKS